MTIAAIITTCAAVAALGLAADASAQPSRNADQCFFTRDIQNILAPDDHTLYLRVRNSAIYRIDTVAECPQLPFNDGHISLQTTPGASTVCSAIDLDLKVFNNGVSTPCLIKSLQKLTPQEAAALPKTDTP
jgi:hypothetical protein